MIIIECSSSKLGSITRIDWVIDDSNVTFAVGYAPIDELNSFPYINDTLVGFTLTAATFTLLEVPKVGDTVTIRYATNYSSSSGLLVGLTLAQVRAKFRDISGRYDLVDGSNIDNGANFFIQEASKWLDKKADRQMIYKNTGRHHSNPLIVDSDTNYWSINYPLLLVQTAIYKTYSTSGNIVMKKTYEADIAEQLVDIDMSWIERETHGTDHMEDSDD
jgi:hypothetical protein